MKFTIKLQVEVRTHTEDVWTEDQLREAALEYLDTLPETNLINSTSTPFHQTDLSMDGYKIRADICVTTQLPNTTETQN